MVNSHFHVSGSRHRSAACRILSWKGPCALSGQRGLLEIPDPDSEGLLQFVLVIILSRVAWVAVAAGVEQRYPLLLSS